MEKPGTINVVGEDNTAEISRAIIKTHQYVLQNVAVLNDRERGYMFNEYFPAVKRYLEDPLEVLVPMAPENPPDELNKFKGFVSDVNLGEPYIPNPDAETFTEEFRYSKDVQLLSFNLTYQPEEIRAVWIASEIATFEVNRYRMIETQDYIFNLTTGTISFPEFFLPEFKKEELKRVLESLKIKNHFSIFVEYVRKEGPVPTEYAKQAKPYEVGTDGEN